VDIILASEFNLLFSDELNNSNGWFAYKIDKFSDKLLSVISIQSPLSLTLNRSTYKCLGVCRNTFLTHSDIVSSPEYSESTVVSNFV